MRRLGTSTIVACALLLLIGGVVVQCQRQVRADREGAGSYFRLKVDLTYDGQPVGIDIVVGCHVRIGHSIGGGSSVDTTGMSAFVFAREIPDGHAISVRTEPATGGNGNPCRGATTANGGIEPDFLPAVVWYDRADDLSHGFAYVTRDAYRSPAARLVFGSAGVEAATKADFRRFLARAKPNLIPYYIADAITHLETPNIRSAKDVTPDLVAQPTRAWPRTGWTTCRGMQRWLVPPHLADAVRQRWPADRPRLWAPDPTFTREVFRWITTSPRTTPNLASPRDYVLLPSVRDDGLSQLSATTFQDGTYYDDTATADADTRRGFLFCDRDTPDALYEAKTGRKAGKADGVHIVCRMDGQIISSNARCNTDFRITFQDDQFIYAPFQSFKD